MPAPNPYNSSSDAENADAETRRLRQAYAALPKTPHGETIPQRHPETRPEWVMSIIENPFDQSPTAGTSGEDRVELVGRVPEFNQWIVVILEYQDGIYWLHSAFPERRKERKYGGRPWETE